MFAARRQLSTLIPPKIASAKVCARHFQNFLVFITVECGLICFRGEGQRRCIETPLCIQKTRLSTIPSWQIYTRWFTVSQIAVFHATNVRKYLFILMLCAFQSIHISWAMIYPLSFKKFLSTFQSMILALISLLPRVWLALKDFSDDQICIEVFEYKYIQKHTQPANRFHSAICIK